MNLQSKIAETAVSCPVLDVDGLQKIKYGNMQIKSWPLRLSAMTTATIATRDDELNTFLKENHLYIMNFGSSITGEFHIINITYRQILNIENIQPSSSTTSVEHLIINSNGNVGIGV